jgi:hypothetical protein
MDDSMTIATRHRGGLMGMEHARKLDKIKADILLSDPAAYGDIAPTLDLDFTNIYGAPFPGNFSRPTIGGYRLNAKGVMVPTVANEPNIDFGTDGKPLGTGFYGAYTNLLTWSEDFTNAAWTKGPNVTVTPNNVAAPDGNLTADRIAASSGDNAMSQSALVTGNQYYTFSIWLRSDSSIGLTLLIFDGTGGGNTTLNVTATTDWQQFSLTRLVPAGQTGVVCYIGGAGSFTNETIYAWGAQLTATAFPVPYVPTTSATVARNADVFLLSGTDVTDAANSLEGTFYAEAYAPRSLSGYPALLQLDDGGFNNRSVIFYNSAGQAIGAGTDVAAVNTATFTSQTISRGSFFRLAYTYKANAFVFVVNGAPILTDTAGAVPSGMNRIRIGDTWDEHIRRVIYWPKAFSALDMKRITA